MQAWRNVTYEYNANGIRAGKTIDTIEHKYYLLGSKILLETINDGGSVNTLQYLYDNSEEVSGISYNGTEYCYVKNLQGDVIRVIDSNGECVVKYVYNSWGKVIEVTDAQGNAVTSSAHIGNINPIRYRSYYYDTETKYYYLQSRYYDPETGRFLNADSIENATLQMDQLNGLNLYAFCLNNPVNEATNAYKSSKDSAYKARLKRWMKGKGFRTSHLKGLFIPLLGAWLSKFFGFDN